MRLPRPIRLRWLGAGRLRWLGAGALCACLATSASAADPQVASRSESAPEGKAACVPAAIADVKLGGQAKVDEIRVILASGSPDAGAALVTVDDGEFDRVVRVRGGFSKILKFEPALSADAFRVSLSPVLEAHRDACVERIELVRGGQPVATVRP